MSGQLEAASYFITDNQGVLVDDFRGKLKDEHNIVGWIELRDGENQILGREHWDLVDQLWAYIIDGLVTIDEGADKWKSYFPDQPLLIELSRTSRSTLCVTIGGQSFTVNYRKIKNELARVGLDFFERMSVLVPASSDVWDQYIEKCRSLTSE
ncbi:MAG: hypothetical protein Aurels2KO_44620 [Aureliella sp.]